MTVRTALRGTAILISVGLIVLWVLFAHDIFARSQFMPAPAGVMLPVFFCGLALGAGLAALRGEGVSVALAGALSLVPMGIFLVFFPGSPRLIAVFDISLIALGILLMKTEGERVGDPD